jgi:DNA-binding NtrC family response regulator
MKVVLADDEKSIRITLGDEIRDAGHELAVFDNGAAALEHIRTRGCDALVCDLQMPGLDGLALQKQALETNPLVKVILITGYGTVETAVAAMKAGAYDYVLKPFVNAKIVHMLANIADLDRFRRENAALRVRVREGGGAGATLAFHGMVGTSPAVQDVFRRIEQVAPTDANVLVEGESGTGKELVARAIHALSPRRERDIVVLSCAASPETLIEDELFGHEPGAFTGALNRKQGKFERADGSTLFIDDIDDMSLNTQVKLVRVLQEHTFERLGGTGLIRTDFRVIAASKQNLRRLVEARRFREDLFFRLNIIPIALPPLRERPGDIELLAHYFKDIHGRDPGYFFTEDTLRRLRSYAWPGNVRELENAILRAVTLCGAREQELRPEYIFQSYDAVPAADRPLGQALADFEKQFIAQVLRATGNHKTRAAEILGISRKTLWEKLKGYGLSNGIEP